MKGFLFTASLLLISLATMGLAIIVMEGSQAERAETIQLFAMDAMKSNVLWIENGFREMVGQAGVRVIVSNRTASIRERVPNPSAANFSQNVQKWASFAASHSQFSPSVRYYRAGAFLPLALRPSVIVYNHSSGFGSNSFRVESASQAVNYSLDLRINIPQGTVVKWSSLSSGTLGFRLRVFAGNQTNLYQKVNPDATSTLTVRAQTSTITVTVGSATDRGRLSVSNPSNLNLTATTNVTWSLSGKPMVTFPYDAIAMSSGTFNASSAGMVRIA